MFLKLNKKRNLDQSGTLYLVSFLEESFPSEKNYLLIRDGLHNKREPYFLIPNFQVNNINIEESSLKSRPYSIRMGLLSLQIQ